MATLVILITARVDEVHTIGEAWKNVGAPGVTLIEGYGLRRLQEVSKSSEILPGMLSLLEIMRDNEQTSMILLAVIEEDDLVDKLRKTTEDVLGSLLLPGSGIFFVINVEQVIGLQNYNK